MMQLNAAVEVKRKIEYAQNMSSGEKFVPQCSEMEKRALSQKET